MRDAPERFEDTLRKTAEELWPHREALTGALTAALRRLGVATQGAEGEFHRQSVDRMLSRLEAGDLERYLREEAEAAAETVRKGVSVRPLALAIRALDRCCVPFLLRDASDARPVADSLLALDELGQRRLELFVEAHEDAAARHVVEAQEDAAQRAEKARELMQLNDALRLAQRQSQHRADQIGLVSSVAHRIASILDPEQLMQGAADAIQTRANHTYVAVVVLDRDGMLVGRWAGRTGVGRRSSGRAQSPAGGVIGRALRKRAPQVVVDVTIDRDYHADVPGTRSEMVVPLIEEGEIVGAMDFQSETTGAFDLDDVAAGEAIAQFVVVGLRNARLFAATRGAGASI